MRFKGWKHPGKSRSDYVTRFSRPRARAAYAELLKNAARVVAHNTSPSAQFALSALPGILLRDSLPAGYIPTAVAMGDFNGDGKLDFVVVNGGDNTLWIYFGKGDGTFQLPIIIPVTLGKSPTWIATGDLRGIGRTDLVLAEPDSNSVGVFLSNGDGTFVETAFSIPDTATFVMVGDFNKDGKLDIVAPINDENSQVYIAMLPGVGNGSFGKPILTPLAGYAPYIIYGSVADLNQDGIPDLLLVSDGSIEEIAVQVFIGKGDGTFTAGQVVAQDYGAAVLLTSVLFDADGDGLPDAVLGDLLGELWIYHGNGDGTFSTNVSGLFQLGAVSFDIAAADVNGDGHLDIIVSGAPVNDLAEYGTQAGDQICVLEGDGKGNFGSPQVYRGDSSSYSLAVGDFNGDGHPDVVTANQDNDSATVFLNNGKGGYGAPGGNWVGNAGGGAVNAPMSGVLMADVDGNGSTDVAFLEWPPDGDNYFQLTVLLNDGSGNLSAPIRSDALNFLNGDWVLADFRNTGHPDFLAIAENYNSNPNSFSFAPNSGGGHFGPVTETNSPNANGVIGVGDFNHDGKLDFVAVGFGVGNDPNNQQGIQVFLGNGDGTFRAGYVQGFGSVTSYSREPAAVYVGDFNRDGNLDLLVLINTTFDLYEFLGNGDGTFQPSKLLIPAIGPMTVADVDGDGYPDIVTMVYPQLSQVFEPNVVQFSIYIGQSDGTFQLTNTYAPYNGMGAFAQQPYSPIYGKYTPLVADFNGDGKLDIAAFQQIGVNYIGGANTDTFVQFLLGNGDGTFTPTYEIFDFRKPVVTAYAADLTGKGRPDLFELNGYRSTYNVLPAIVAPAFQFGLLGDPVSGPQGSGIVLLDIPSATPSTVSLTASDPGIQVPANVTIPAGNISQIFTFNIGSAFNPNHAFAITAQLGSTSATAYGTVSGTAGFQAGAASVVSLAAGQTESDLGEGVTSVNGYSGTVSMECVGLSAVGQCTFAPPSLTVHPGELTGGSMSFSALAGIPHGSYTGTVRATDGATTQNLPITINIGDFTLSLSPQPLQVFPNGSGSYQLTVGSINQFNQVVNLTCSGLPTGATCSTFPGWTRPPTGSTPISIGVQVQSVPVGNYQITVTGTSGPLTHAATAQLQVSDFTAAVSPANAPVPAGGSTNFNVTVSPINGFDGSVSLQCSSSVPVSCSFSPASVAVPAGGNGTSVLTVSPSQSVPVGSYPLTISGTSSQITHTTTAQLQVTADFTASVSPTSATVSAGGSANFKVGVTSQSGFSGSVSFACSASSSLVACSFNPASLMVPANGTGTSVLTANAISKAASSTKLRKSLIPILALGLVLPIGALSVVARSRRRWLGCVVVVLLVSGIPSCGGSQAGGGGGAGSQTYSITVQVSSGNAYTTTAGTITLTVN